jgi:dephospho-CoA kinase
VIGVVGGIGSGKSAAAALLGERGAFVIDADQVGHALLNQRPVRDRVVARFGAGVLALPGAEGSEPEVDRGALGAVVFADPKALKDLEAIVHPRMRRTFEKAIARTVRRGRAVAVVLDAAVLFEAGWNALCDRVLFVDAPRPQRLARLSAQRGWTEATLDARERAQRPLDEKKARADLVVTNAGDPEALREAVGQAWEAVLASRPRRTRAPGRFGQPGRTGTGGR